MQRRLQRGNRFLLTGGCLVAASFFLAASAHATGGTMSSVSKFAWGSTGGWVNFAPTNSTVTVTDSNVTGYAWSANNGWINLAPSQGGVHNDGLGNLSGYAWDPAAGWISFSGVTIDSSGRFRGQAVGAGETIDFDCASCNVQTSWRITPPASNGAISIPVLTQPTVPAIVSEIESTITELSEAQRSVDARNGQTSSKTEPTKLKEFSKPTFFRPVNTAAVSTSSSPYATTSNKTNRGFSLVKFVRSLVTTVANVLFSVVHFFVKF